MVLEKINQPNDIKSLTDEELKILASEINRKDFSDRRSSGIESGGSRTDHGTASCTGSSERQDYMGCGTSVLHAQASDRKTGRF